MRELLGRGREQQAWWMELGSERRALQRRDGGLLGERMEGGRLLLVECLLGLAYLVLVYPLLASFVVLFVLVRLVRACLSVVYPVGLVYPVMKVSALVAKTSAVTMDPKTP